MIDYISQIQKKLISEYKLEKDERGFPKNVPDGEYTMEINGRTDYVKIKDGKINCGNFDAPA